MKIYLVEITTDTFTDIDKVFTTFRGASQYLIDKGFEPYTQKWHGELKLRFFLDDPEWYSKEAKIIEKDLMVG